MPRRQRECQGSAPAHRLVTSDIAEVVFRTVTRRDKAHLVCDSFESSSICFALTQRDVEARVGGAAVDVQGGSWIATVVISIVRFFCRR